LNNHLRCAESEFERPEIREQSPTIVDESDTIIREGEKAPNTDFRKNLAIDFKKKIKSIDVIAWKMRDIKSKGLA